MRYKTDNFSPDVGYRTAQSTLRIRRGIGTGEVTFSERILKEGERLDMIAGSVYGDGRLWWVIAAASDIGWPLQAPPGTVLRVPDLASALGVL